VLERQPDDFGKIIRNVGEVQDPNRVYLAIVRDGKITKNTKASVQPIVGYNVFDSRHYQEDEAWMTERHFGNKVTEITYDD